MGGQRFLVWEKNISRRQKIHEEISVYDFVGGGDSPYKQVVLPNSIPIFVNTNDEQSPSVPDYSPLFPFIAIYVSQHKFIPQRFCLSTISAISFFDYRQNRHLARIRANWNLRPYTVLRSCFQKVFI